jgi:hypothetical protein
VFNAGSFSNVLGSETWLETWQGVQTMGCYAPAAPHDGSSPATYIYNEAAGTLTISGSGAYIGLPKAHNGGEDGMPANDAIAYLINLVDDYTMILDIEAGSGIWWRYKLVKVSSSPTPTIFGTCGISLNVLNVDENKRSYSSVYGNDAIGTGHARSMLDSSQAWSAGSNTAGQWMKMDLGEVQKIDGVVTQQRAIGNWGNQRVTKFQVMTSVDDAVYVDRGTYPGHVADEGNKKIYTYLETADVPARWVKIVMIEYVSHTSMRAGVILAFQPHFEELFISQIQTCAIPSKCVIPK